MSAAKKRLLIFGGGPLQKSLITQANLLGIETVVIDPDSNAIGKFLATHFVIVGGADFEGTCKVVDDFLIDGIITSATDKPLVMMARIAEKYNFPFYSVETAETCTDKSAMKQVFERNNIACAKGKLVASAKEIIDYPTIIKPLDNSGSRGVFYVTNGTEATDALSKCFEHTSQELILAEQVLLGQEYSVEALHFDGKTEVIQITEKKTTEFPTNVEIGHHAPANLSTELSHQIKELIHQIGIAFSFTNCASHTEIKIESGTISVIETSSRLGGDFITSHLVPLSSGFNIESALIRVALGLPINEKITQSMHASVFYFELTPGVIKKMPKTMALDTIEGVVAFELNLNEGSVIPKIENSLNRYGYCILQAANFASLYATQTEILRIISNNLKIEEAS